jgi:hypothetical protein
VADNTKTNRGDPAAKKPQRPGDGGMQAYEAERNALLARTAKLRQLRLAHEAEVAANAPPPEPKKLPKSKAAKTTKAGAKAKKPAESLSTWMKNREGSGHNS